MRAARRAGFKSASPKPYRFEVPGPDKPLVQELFLPHEIYPNLVEQTGGDLAPWCLEPSQLASPTGLGALLHGWSRHTDVNVPGGLDRTAIMGIHCDGASYTSSTRAGGMKSVLVGSLNMISAPTVQKRCQRHLLFVVSKKKLCDCGCSGFCTYQAIFNVVAWSMRCLATASAPTARHDGSAWTKDDKNHRVNGALPRCALLQIRGDMLPLSNLQSGSVLLDMHGDIE